MAREKSFKRNAARLLALSISIIVSLSAAFLITGCKERSIDQGPHISIKLLADQDALTPGSSFTLGVMFEPEPGWHIYWKNPGDSGLAPRFAWESSGGIAVAAPLWPYPERISVGHLVNFGYDKALILFPATFSAPPPRATSTSVTLSLQYLVCKDECLPGEAQLELTLPISKTAPPPGKHEQLFAQALKKVPSQLERVSIAVEEQDDQIIIALIPLEARFFPSTATFFPEQPRTISNSASQEVALDSGALRITLKRDPNRREPIRGVRGVLVSQQGWSESGEPKAITIDSSPNDTDEPQVPLRTPQSTSVSTNSNGGVIALLTALIFAFIGGLILNVMPCVFPVLSIKVLGFIEQAGHEPRKIKLHGLSFSAGVITSFWVLAAIIIGLRAGGEQLGWGFQLQSPIFVAIMIFTFLILGLLFLTEVSIGNFVQRLAGSSKLSATYLGSFANGALATAVATPCTAPFMGSAIAATLTLPALSNLLVFTALGLGMSSPYILIAYRPNLLSRLPRPGAWMDNFKQFMAFPLFASVVWLSRVFARQMGLEAPGLNVLSDLLWGLVGIAFAFWLLVAANRSARPLTQRGLRFTASISLILGLMIGIPSRSEVESSRSRACIANENTTPEPDQFGLIWEPYSEQRLASLLAQGRNIYIDFTAEWCITCQVNDRIVFGSSDVRSLIVQKNVVLMRGDWTTRSPSITAALHRYGRNSVPANVIIKNGKADTAVVLPTVLTPGTVVGELGRL